MNSKVSVIIPAYNTEEYIGNCIQSVIDQTYQEYEIIVVNDGSTDSTLEKVKECQKKCDKIKIIDIENHGQGYARNKALKEAKGDYVLFLDSDDFIEPVTLQVCIKRIKEDQSDLVVFDWKEYWYNTEKYRYANSDKFFNRRILENEEVAELFKIRHYFSVNKLYAKKFLLENKIFYGEGHIYEDNPFWVKVVINAKKVSLIHSPLYNVGIAKVSTTRSNLDTNKHAEDYIEAIKKIIDIIQKRPDICYDSLYNYIMKKFNLYYRKRVPKKYHKKFIYDFVEVMSNMVPLKNLNIKNTLIRTGCKYNIFKDKKKFQFYIEYQLFVVKRKLKEICKKYVSKYKRLKRKVKTFFKILKNAPSTFNGQAYKKALQEELDQTILFMGFDYKYTGNSRYLFEQILKKRSNDIYFVTESDEVEEAYKILPESQEMYEKLYHAKVVVFESWIPRRYRKREGQIWLQLWHGTPLKKMLFDSEEKEIIEKSPKHKIQKYNDIKKWDYLLADNPNIDSYFQTSFLMNKQKILNYGYPRVKYLIENRNNQELKDKIRQKAGIGTDQKVILYLPTWRDYNYGKQEDFDYEYILNSEKLKKEINDDNYIIIEKNHVYLKENAEIEIHNMDIETQELLLIANYLITDYSSVMFDAFAIDLPILILANDYEKYKKARGVYEDIWQDLKPFITENEQDLAAMLKQYKLDENYRKIKEKYSYKNVNQNELDDFVIKL